MPNELDMYLATDVGRQILTHRVQYSKVKLARHFPISDIFLAENLLNSLVFNSSTSLLSQKSIRNQKIPCNPNSRLSAHVLYSLQDDEPDHTAESRMFKL